jgi:hypothetical protein
VQSYLSSCVSQTAFVGFEWQGAQCVQLSRTFGGSKPGAHRLAHTSHSLVWLLSTKPALHASTHSI